MSCMHCQDNVDDLYLALLVYRSTYLHNGFSSAELLMGQKLRTTLPMLPSQLEPSTPDYSQLLQKNQNSGKNKIRTLIHITIQKS